MGLITKHGILIVEFTNQLREQGLELTAAVVKGASQRLRPILMTTGAMVLGAIPLALAHGAGSESRRQIGWVIVGGMSLGTLLTIFVVPTIYTLFARKAVPGPITAEARDGHAAGDAGHRVDVAAQRPSVEPALLPTRAHAEVRVVENVTRLHHLRLVADPYLHAHRVELRLFSGRQVLAQVLVKAPPPIEAVAPEVSRELAAITNRAMARKPDERQVKGRETYPDHCAHDPRWHVEPMNEAWHVNYHLGFRCCKTVR